MLSQAKLCLEACPARPQHSSAARFVKASSEEQPQCLQVFMDKEAGPEGAEIPSAVPAAGGAADVSMDYKRFWRELGETLGMQPGIHMLQRVNHPGSHCAFPRPRDCQTACTMQCETYLSGPCDCC